ncbi:thioredoxin [Desulfurispirillum indicum]|uniref:Thioredoxin n=1 Tax=Desulfurispirillum indicum (strain ATCC BAA-1389 / DSM 22839 / S5) TaxID=653733 RepID=E6W116_DESIS|nr:thioredoxin [Desulfurispirillum indicum]ADU65348.1 thioredoxin [Desulfurispirillum indicum S5]UCZ57244.1 thioredoxin [Desulfurispirillum indicum]
MAAESVLNFTDASFDSDVLQSSTPVLVDYWASWCAPCRMLSPTIDALAEEFVGKAKVGKVNVDENPQTSQKFGVRSIPTIMIFKGGQVVDQAVGVQSKEALKALLTKHL